MLSRTADHLFWMARYTERAENTARMLDVQVQSDLLRQSRGDAGNAWAAVLGLSELSADYRARHGEITPQRVLDYMVRDPDNLSSIYSCLRAAREIARAVRGAITTETWETVNQTWLELMRKLQQPLHDPGALFEWVKDRSHLTRGVTADTMLRDEAFHFLRLGTLIERADNTARLLDVKFHAPQAEQTQTQTSEARMPEQDFYHWSGVLRSVSGFEIYRKFYRYAITPERVAEMLILRPNMPRSLAACTMEISDTLGKVANPQSADTLRSAGMLDAELRYGRIEDIMATGLHAYLTRFLVRINDLASRISQDFLAA